MFREYRLKIYSLVKSKLWISFTCPNFGEIDFIDLLNMFLFILTKEQIEHSGPINGAERGSRMSGRNRLYP